MDPNPVGTWGATDSIQVRHHPQLRAAVPMEKLSPRSLQEPSMWHAKVLTPGRGKEIRQPGKGRGRKEMGTRDTVPKQNCPPGSEEMGGPRIRPGLDHNTQGVRLQWLKDPGCMMDGWMDGWTGG